MSDLDISLTRLSNARNDIAEAISDKGVTVPSLSGFEDFPSLIDSISTGGTYQTVKLTPTQASGYNLNLFMICNSTNTYIFGYLIYSSNNILRYPLVCTYTEDIDVIMTTNPSSSYFICGYPGRTYSDQYMQFTVDTSQKTVTITPYNSQKTSESNSFIYYCWIY